MADLRKDSSRKISAAQERLEQRYHEIGISAVAAAMRFCNLPDAKEPVCDPDPAHGGHHSGNKAA